MSIISTADRERKITNSWFFRKKLRYNRVKVIINGVGNIVSSAAFLTVFIFSFIVIYGRYVIGFIYTRPSMSRTTTMVGI